MTKLHRAIDILWDYMQVGDTPSPSDCIFVLCSNDTRVAEYAAQLFKQGIAPYIVFSGGVGRFTEGQFNQSEAETFATIARDCGVPGSAIIVETQASNTGENVRFTYELLKNLGEIPKQLTLVQKPFMEKRTYATFKQQWPDKDAQITVTSQRQHWVEYYNEEIPLEMVLGALIADFERVKAYPRLGFQIALPIPENVELAYQQLKRVGFEAYTNHSK